MRRLGAIAVILFLAGCATVPSWTPRVEKAIEPSEVIAAAPSADWQEIPAHDLLVMDLGNGGRIIIQLAPEFAPVHVANIRAFARAKWWGDASIYRLQDNYVAQWGNGEAALPLPAGTVKTPPAEYERPLSGLQIRPLGYPDAYAPSVGHADGWNIGYDKTRGQAWLTHCYGSVGVGRDLAPDTGTGGELYAVIGHAPRHLDRNIASVGRVIEGMENLSAIRRGGEALGFIADKADHVGIKSIALAADLPVAERPRFAYLRTDSSSFAQYVRGRANRGGDFFIQPAGGVDICNAPVPIRTIK